MAKEEAIELEGTVTEVLPDATFKVLVSNGHDVHATIAGKMRRFRIRVLEPDWDHVTDDYETPVFDDFVWKLEIRLIAIANGRPI